MARRGDSANLDQGNQSRTWTVKRPRGVEESEEPGRNSNPHAVPRNVVKRRRLSLLEGATTVYQSEVTVRSFHPVVQIPLSHAFCLERWISCTSRQRSFPTSPHHTW